MFYLLQETFVSITEIIIPYKNLQNQMELDQITKITCETGAKVNVRNK